MYSTDEKVKDTKRTYNLTYIVNMNKEFNGQHINNQESSISSINMYTKNTNLIQYRWNAWIYSVDLKFNIYGENN